MEWERLVATFCGSWSVNFISWESYSAGALEIYSFLFKELMSFSKYYLVIEIFSFLMTGERCLELLNENYMVI